MNVVGFPSSGDEPREERASPSNVEAEQMVLGAALCDNEAFFRCEGLEPHHFHEPLHAEIWRLIGISVTKDRLAEPRLLNDRLMATQPGYVEFGGLRYLADLIDRGPPAVMAHHYAREIIDLGTARELLRVSGEIAADARNHELSGREKLDSAEQKLFAVSDRGQIQSGARPFSESLTRAVETTAEAYRRDGSLSGLSTGLTDLDQRTGGLQPSDLIILAARPSMGKSSLAANIAFHVARKHAFSLNQDGSRQTTAGGVVALFSLEMSAEQLALRILAEVSGIPSDRARKGQITAVEFGRIAEAATQIQEAPLYIDDTGGLSVARLCSIARRMKRTTGLELVVVDYLQLLTTGRKDNRVQEVTEITQTLKALAKELRVPVVALSQLSRQVENREDKRPQLADLRESGSIEQDADVVMFLYREAYYLGRAEPKADSAEHRVWLEKMGDCRQSAELIIAKQRHGPIGTTRLHYNEELTKFSDPAREHQHVQARLPYAAD